MGSRCSSEYLCCSECLPVIVDPAFFNSSYLMFILAHTTNLNRIEKKSISDGHFLSDFGSASLRIPPSYRGISVRNGLVASQT